MRKRKVLFLCNPTGQIHPCAVEAMSEVGIDISDQYPKGLKTYLGKEFFNYLIIVCARAEEKCPKTFPGVGTRLAWIFEDPRREEDIPYDSMLERFRVVRDQIELQISDWLEHPEAELRKLKEERERERRERLTAARREANEQAQRMAGLSWHSRKRHHSVTTSTATLVCG